MRPSLPITNPVHASPTRVENERIWTRVWVCAGVEQQVAETGDLLPITVGDYGMHLRRESDGRIRAAFNLLQHGSCWTIPEQCRSGHKTSCPYTACAFSRDSDTVSAVDGQPVDGMRQFIGFNPLKLHDVPVERLGPLVFLSLATEEPPDLRAQLGDLANAIDDLRLNRSPYLGRFWTDLDCHWANAGDAVLRAIGADESDLLTTVATPAELARTGNQRDTDVVRVWRSFPNLVVVAAPDHVAVIVIKPIGFTAVSAVVSLFATELDSYPHVSGAGARLLEVWRGLMGSVRSHATEPDLGRESAMAAIVYRYLAGSAP